MKNKMGKKLEIVNLNKLIIFILTMICVTTTVNAISNSTNDLAYYTLDGVKTDSTGNGNTLTDGSTVPVVTNGGKLNQGYNFSGSTDYFQTPLGHTDIGLSFSISMWIKTFDSNPATKEYIFSSSAGTCKDSPLIAMNSNGTLHMSARGTITTVGHQNVLGAPLNNNTWYHVVLSYDQTNMLMFVNGVLQRNVTGNTGNWCAFPVVPLGTRNDVPTQDWNGLIDEVFIVNYAMTTNNVTDLYNSGVGQTYPFIAGVSTITTNITTYTKNPVNSILVTSENSTNISYISNGQDVYVNDTLLYYFQAENNLNNRQGNYGVGVVNGNLAYDKSVNHTYDFGS
jgi:hypothetical protein